MWGRYSRAEEDPTASYESLDSCAVVDWRGEQWT